MGGVCNNKKKIANYSQLIILLFYLFAQRFRNYYHNETRHNIMEVKCLGYTILHSMYIVHTTKKFLNLTES